MDDLKINLIDQNTEDAGLLRTSTFRQQVDGDPLPIQKDKIEFSVNKNHKSVGLWVEVAMPASGKFETQPLLKALKFFETIPTIKRVWTSIVNRATRGEPLDFLLVKQAYAKKGIQLVDTQGELLSETKDTLEAYGVEYKFNQYDGNEQQIISSVIAARTNWRENLTQLHSAEIKYARLGYWVHGNVSEGLKKVRVQNEHGKRWVLEPNPNKSLWFRRMFELSLKKVPNAVIVMEVNRLGYRSRHNQELTIKQLGAFLRRPIFALVNGSCSQQIGQKPQKIIGTGYISIDEFNEINQGKIRIIESEKGIQIVKGKLATRSIKTKSDNFPFKQFVLCPVCKNKLWGSSPRGRLGGYYPQYHCHKGHPYWHVSQKDFDTTILDFTKNLKLTDNKLAQYKEALLGKVKDKLVTIKGVSIDYQLRVTQLESQSKELIIKIRNSKLQIVQADLENELEKVEANKLLAIAERDRFQEQQIDIYMVIDRVMYFLEHLEKGLLGIANPVVRAAAWSTIFEEPPTYKDLVSRTPRLRSHIELISTSATPQSLSVDSRGLEPLTSSV